MMGPLPTINENHEIVIPVDEIFFERLAQEFGPICILEEKKEKESTYTNILLILIAALIIGVIMITFNDSDIRSFGFAIVIIAILYITALVMLKCSNYAHYLFESVD